MADAKTRLVALIGHPVEHSLSPAIHNAAFKEFGLNYVYLAFDVLPHDLSKAVDAMKALGFRGYSVTMPHKQAIIEYLDRVDGIAEKIQAVNTVINDDGKLTGYNKDAGAAITVLKAKTSLHGKKVALLGCGGAGRAIAFALQEENAGLTVLDRDFSKAQSLAAAVGCSSQKPDSLNSLDMDILINATPVGMAPNVNSMPVDKNTLKKGLTVFDIVYSPIETMLLREAKKAGCETISGIEMLLEQGFEQFKLWAGKDAPKKLMREVVLKELSK